MDSPAVNQKCYNHGQLSNFSNELSVQFHILLNIRHMVMKTILINRKIGAGSQTNELTPPLSDMMRLLI